MRSIKILSDTLSYFISVYISFLFYNIPVSIALKEVNYFLIIGGYLLFIFSILNYKGYDQAIDFSLIREITSLINAALLMIIVSILILFIFQIETTVFLTISSQIFFCLSLLFSPIILRTFFNSIIKINIQKEPSLLIGIGKMGKSFIDLVSKSESDRFDIIGIFDDKFETGYKYNGYEVVDKVDGIDNFLENNNINRIIVAVRHLPEDKISFIASKAAKYDISLNFLPSIESFQNDPGKLKEHAGIPFISNRFQAQSLFYRLGKRLFDMSLSIIGVILCIPFLLIIPFIIKKDSEGPIIFKHTRVGLDGKSFSLYKFRTMFIDSPKYAHCPSTTDDPRITKVGRWLRKTSLDELPQLFNVIKGEMSMVGPRPEMPFIVNNYNNIEKKRLLIKPGLTGLWQISPHRSAEISHNLEYDFYYIENQGFVMDLVIVILTFFFALRGFTH